VEISEGSSDPSSNRTQSGDEGSPISKRGKLSGVKDVYRTPDGGHHVALADRDGPDEGEALLEPLIRDGEIVREFDLEAASSGGVCPMPIGSRSQINKLDCLQPKRSVLSVEK